MSSINALRGWGRPSAGNYDDLLSEEDRKISRAICDYCEANEISLGYHDNKIKSLKVFCKWLSDRGFDISLADILIGVHCREQVDMLMNQYVVDKDVELRFRNNIENFVEEIRGVENIESILNSGAGAHH